MQGWHGWDDYADFYDWENARTLGRRDVPFWRRLVAERRAATLELGCGTGRLLAPIARTGVPVTGIDRSAPMLEYAVRRIRRLPRVVRPSLVRGDIRALPFPAARFGLVLAAYGLAQSLLRDADLTATFSEVARVLRRGGLAAFDLVPDLPAWDEYTGRVVFRGRSQRGGRLALVESVRQKRRAGLTVFTDEFVERRGRRVERRQFTLTFRTIGLPAFAEALDRAGLEAETMYGSYRGDAMTPGADAWIVLARRR